MKKIFKPHVISVCKVNGGTECCKHLARKGTIFICDKIQKVPSGYKFFPQAEGDNCGGRHITRAERSNNMGYMSMEMLELNSLGLGKVALRSLHDLVRVVFEQLILGNEIKKRYKFTWSALCTNGKDLACDYFLLSPTCMVILADFTAIGGSSVKVIIPEPDDAIKIQALGTKPFTEKLCQFAELSAAPIPGDRKKLDLTIQRNGPKDIIQFSNVEIILLYRAFTDATFLAFDLYDDLVAKQKVTT